MKLAERLKRLCEELISLPNSLGYKRSELPQIPKNKLKDFLQYLKETGVGYEEKKLPANTLTPSQKELDTDKADNIWKDGATEEPIFTSSDNYVLDGHHRWFAVKRNAPEKDLNCIMLNKNSQDAIKLMHDFEHAKVKDINGKTL